MIDTAQLDQATAGQNLFDDELEQLRKEAALIQNGMDEAELLAIERDLAR